jgi:polar amino acid transport system permease protein
MTTTRSGPAPNAGALPPLAKLKQLPRSSQRHPWRWAASILVLAYAAELIRSFITNERFSWPTVGEYLFDPEIMSGLGITCLLTALSMLGAMLLGIVISEMRVSRTPVVTALAQLYIWVFRSVPALVILLITFNIGALYPTLALNIPFGPQIVGFSATAMSGLTIAVIAFSVQHSAYVAEIIRGAVMSVPVGQSEAAMALGMTYARTRARIILPAAFRVALPSLMNELTSMLKLTSIVGFIGYTDLLHSAEKIYTQNYEVLPMLIVASLWYVAIVSVLTLAQRWVETRLSRSARRGGSAKGARGVPSPANPAGKNSIPATSITNDGI